MTGGRWKKRLRFASFEPEYLENYAGTREGKGAKTKRALIVTTVSGFVPQFEMNNVRILQELGYEVHYASNFRNPSYGNDNSRLAGTGLVCHQIDMERSPFRVCSLYRAYRQLKSLMQKIQFNLIHCHTPVGGVLGRLAAKSVQNSTYNQEKSFIIYTAHGFHFYKGAPLINWLLYYPAEWWLTRYTDVMITMNREDYARAKRFCRYKRTRIRYIPGEGVDTAYYSGKNLPEGEREAIRRAVRKELSVDDGTILLLSVGELIRRKNHSAVIRALAELEREKENERENESGAKKSNSAEKKRETGDVCPGSFRYLICGQGVLRDELQRQIDRLGLSGKVCLPGYCKDIRALLYAADVFVFPSRQEGMPMALLEAAAAGLPLILSDIRGNRDVAETLGNTGCFAGQEELKRRLREAIASKEQGWEQEERQTGDAKDLTDGERANPGTRPGPEFALRFDLKQAGKRMQNIYREFKT